MSPQSHFPLSTQMISFGCNLISHIFLLTKSSENGRSLFVIVFLWKLLFLCISNIFFGFVCLSAPFSLSQLLHLCYSTSLSVSFLFPSICLYGSVSLCLEMEKNQCICKNKKKQTRVPNKKNYPWEKAFLPTWQSLLSWSFQFLLLVFIT